MEITKSELLEIAMLHGVTAIENYYWQGIIDKETLEEIMEELEG